MDNPTNTNHNHAEDIKDRKDDKYSKVVIYCVLFVIIILSAMYIYGRMILVG